MKPFDEVGIFWDYECCPGPQEASGCAIANAITDLTRPFGRLRLFKAYIDTGDRVLLRSELQVSGVTPVECSRDNNVERLRSILVDLFTFALDNPAPCTIVVISSDRHLAHALSTLKVRQYEVVLIAPPDAHGSLVAQGSVRFDWAEKVVGPASRSSVASLDSCTLTPSALPQAPAKPVRKNSENDVETALQRVEESENEPKSESFTPPPVEVASTLRWRVQVAEAETIVPIDLGRGDNPWSMSMDTTAEEASTSSGCGWFDQKVEEAPWARAPSPWMTSPPLQSTNAQAGWGHDFLADSEADVAGSALKDRAAVTDETDDDQNSVSSESVIYLPPPPMEERREDEGPSSNEHASQGPSANAEMARAPPDEVPAQFLKLVQVLQTYKNQGDIRPSRSDVAVELGYGVYQLAGVGKFGQYVRLAEEAGIVHLGSKKNRPWIGLKPAWYNAVPTIPTEFVKLVEVMQKFQEQGSAEVYPSRVARELGPVIYEEAGVQKFGQYVELAIEREILRRTMRRGKEWLILESQWRYAAQPL